MNHDLGDFGLKKPLFGNSTSETIAVIQQAIKDMDQAQTDYQIKFDKRTTGFLPTVAGTPPNIPPIKIKDIGLDNAKELYKEYEHNASIIRSLRPEVEGLSKAWAEYIKTIAGILNGRS